MVSHIKLDCYDKKVGLADVTHSMKTGHFRKGRLKRYHHCLNLNRCNNGRMAEIDRVFCGHCDDGTRKLYAITKKGIMFVLDKSKFEIGFPSVITVFPATMSQVFYYYRSCGLDVPSYLIAAVKRWDTSVAGKMPVEGISDKNT